jgi:pimeloyl-ACP methyl ester carboxylesterase
MKTVSSVRSKDGTVIAFDRSGTGPALVLVGGAFQFRAFDQRTQQLASILSARFDVYHYDRRGRGESTDTIPYAVEREVEDLEALIAAAGGKAYVFGMSSGAVLALRAAASGLAIRKLALYEPPFNNPAMDSYTKELTSLLAQGRRGDAAALAMKTFGAPPEVVAGARQSPAWLRRPLPTIMPSWAAALCRKSFWHRSAFRPLSWTAARAPRSCGRPRGRQPRRSRKARGGPLRARPTRWPPRCWLPRWWSSSRSSILQAARVPLAASP